MGGDTKYTLTQVTCQVNGFQIPGECKEQQTHSASRS